MTNYQALGIRPVINAYATLTRLGGSRMPPEVIAAMNAAATSFVDLEALQRRVGERLAQLTHNEAAYVSSGAAAGLLLAAAACVVAGDPALLSRFPDISDLKHEVIVQQTQRNGYDYALRQIGINIIPIGTAAGTTRAELEAAISKRTAAYFWFQGAMTTPNDLPLADVIAIMHAHDIPVIVDAAAQLPPVSNLWTFTQMGADLVIFSGGKDLCGPQSSGLMLGRRDLIETCYQLGNPHPLVGRPMKVGKEELLGLLAAVERYLTLDHDARARYCEQTVTDWCVTLNTIAGLSAERAFPNEAGQPLPRCHVTLDTARLSFDRDTLIARLADGDPAVIVAPADANSIYLNPMTLSAGEEVIVLERLIACCQLDGS